MARTCLIAVDVQRGFIKPATAHIPERIEALQPAFDVVIATRFANPEGSPYRRLIHWEKLAPGSPETEFAFRPRDDAHVMDKHVYSCVDADLLALFDAEGVETVHLAGIATDNCVLKSAVDLFECDMTPVVLADACASHGGPEAHAAGLLVLRRMIGIDQVVTAPVAETIASLK